MTYETGKQLWDAGYPFKHRDGDLKLMCLCTEDVCNGPMGREFRFEGNLYPEPTLDELIDACHTRELTIKQKWVDEKKSPQWFASYWVYIIGPYDTLEETLAYLWLRINKKG